MTNKWFSIKEIATERIKVCLECPSAKGIKVMTCKECGCIIKAKALIPASKCPLDKWTL